MSIIILRPTTFPKPFQSFPHVGKQWSAYNIESSQAEGLVAWWPLLAGRGSLDIIEVVGGYHTDSINSTPQKSIDAEMGPVAEFASSGGDDQYYYFSNSIPLISRTSPWTIAIWVNIRSYWGLHGPLRIHSDGSLGLQTMIKQHSGTWRTGFGSNAVQWANANVVDNSETIFLNKWGHYCLTFDGVDATALSSFDLYLDAQIQSLVSTSNYVGNTNNTRIGHNGYDGIDGFISDIRILNRALTTAEVAALYDPFTRWELYTPLKRLFFVPAVDGDLSVSVSDSVTISETVTRLMTSYISVSEPITISEAATVLLVYLISVADSITISEAATLLLLHFVSVSDSITTTEAITMLVPFLLVSISESVSITEAVTMLLNSFIAIGESVSITEVINVVIATLGELNISVIDAVSVTEIINLLLTNIPWTLVGETTFNIQDNDIDQDVTLPGTPATGDIVIYAHSSDQAVSPGVQTTGYTDLLTDHAATNPGHESGYKVMGGTPDTVITFNQANLGEFTTGVLQVWRGVDTGTPIDNTPTTASSGAGMPNPPSYTTITNGALVVAIGFLDDDNVASSVTAPAGYGDLLAHDNTATGGNATTMMASLEKVTAGAEDPAAFGGSGTDAWRAVTFALRPAVVGGDLSVSVSDSVTISEAATMLLLYAISVSDSISIAEAVSLLIPVLFVAVSEPISIAEVINVIITAIADIDISVVEAIAISETIDMLLTGFISVSESVSLAETIVMSITSFVSVSNSITLSESATSSLIHLISVVSSVSLSEAVTARLIYLIQVSETITLSEAVGLLFISFINVLESLSLAEAVNVVIVAVGVLVVSALDTISISESISTQMVSFINAIENITLAESMVSQLVNLVSVSNSIAISESLTTTLESFIHVTETITVSEILTIVIIGLITFRKATFKGMWKGMNRSMR
jgi:hypothetical protein